MNLIHVGKKLQSQIDIKGRLFFSRRRAHSLREKLIKERNKKVVDRRMKRTLKSYSKEIFGSSSYWPWLALYTEIRGEFIQGWLPNDYYTVILLDKYCPPDARISNYKTFDHRLFPGFALEPIIVKISGHLFTSQKRLLTMAEAQNILDDYTGEIVIKEDGGLGGNKVKFIDSNNVDLRNFRRIPNFVIQPVIKQHVFLRRLNPKAVSTFRIVTFLKDNGEVEIKYVFCRFGLGESRVDNTSTGGGFCRIDTNGNLTDLAYNKQAINLGNKHPDTGFIFKTLSIPNYDTVLENCKKSHQSFPYLRIIGWDVTINEEGEPVLLEWNADPGLWMAEAMFGPFWKDDFFSKNRPPVTDGTAKQNNTRSVNNHKRSFIEV